jgi:CBS domain-containing protein
MVTFEKATVSDAMHAELLTCQADSPLGLVAEIMAVERVHCVIVEGTKGDRRDWAIVSDRDLMAAGVDGLRAGTAGDYAATEFLTLTPAESLTRAAQMLAEHDISHLVVVDGASDRALGVLSTLDVARAMAAGDGTGARGHVSAARR